MKNTICVLAILLLVIPAANQLLAQEKDVRTEDTRKQEKIDKKKIKEEAKLAEWEMSKKLAESKRFVFQASDMFTSQGSIPLDAKTNFFYVIDDDAVLQFAFAGLQSIPNPSGIGGITSEAKVTRYSYKATGYEKPVTISVTAQPLAGQGTGIHQMEITIFGDGYAELLFANTGVRLKGSIMSPDKSDIYQGTIR